jgi:hypothetical protein
MMPGFSQTLTLQAGTSVSKINWTNSMTHDQVFTEPVIGPNVSLGLEYLDFRYFNLYSGLSFIQKGGTGTISVIDATDPEVASETTINCRFNYISVNTLFKAKLPIGKVVVPFIQAGPRLDYLLSYSEKYELVGQFADIGQLNKLSYGAQVGVGIEFVINRFKAGAVFDYLWNLNKIVDYTSAMNVKNQLTDQTFLVNLLAGYRF